MSKNQTRSFQNTKQKESQRNSAHFQNSPDKSQGNSERYNTREMQIRFLRKDLNYEQQYVAAGLTQQDIEDLKEVFYSYDSTGMGVLLPNDLKLLLAQNCEFPNPNKKTIYEIVAEFDLEEAGGISFNQFLRAMDTKPYISETKRDIINIFKKYDRTNKNYLTLDDLREINKQVKANFDEETLKLMLEKADSNHDGRISFDDFYSVMVKEFF